MRHTRSIRAVFLAVAGCGGLTAQTPPPVDAQIRDTVRGELHRDTAVAAPLLDVEVRDGIVTLRGTSTNLLVAERAVAIARTVRGVRSVVDRITVEPLVPPTPLELRQAVDHALLLDPATDSYELTVTSHPGGRIELDGTVQSWAERELCARVAKGVDGVTELVNAITLAPATRRPDDELRHDVAQRLHWDLFVDDGLLEVHCDDGVVRLSGTVGSAAERARAVRLAAVAGVERVLADDLDVARWARDDDLRGTKHVQRSDAEIGRAVTAALRHDARVDGFDVEVEVRGGEVTLHGVVDNLKARRAAADDARNTLGVRAVRNGLRVAADERRDDTAIAMDAREALLREPFVTAADVTVRVVDGTAVLHGRVDHHLARARADDAVARVPGVVDVQNVLAVRDATATARTPYVDDLPRIGFDWVELEPWPSFEDDAAIERRIEAELWWSPFVRADRIEVTVEDGVAVLRGRIDSAAERLAAIENALDGGAVRVVDEFDDGDPADAAAEVERDGAREKDTDDRDAPRGDAR